MGLQSLVERIEKIMGMDLQGMLFCTFLGVCMKLTFKMMHKYKITKHVR